MDNFLLAVQNTLLILLHINLLQLAFEFHCYIRFQLKRVYLRKMKKAIRK